MVLPIWVIDYLNRTVPVRFTGKVEINFFEGGVTNINEVKSVKEKDAMDAMRRSAA